MYTSSMTMSKLLLSLLLVSKGITAHAFGIRGQAQHLRNATDLITTSSTLSPSTPSPTAASSSFTTEHAIYTSTARASPTPTLSPIPCTPSSTFILQAISPNPNISGQYIYSPSLESGDTFSLTVSTATASRLVLDASNALLTVGRASPLYATSAMDGSYGPLFMDSVDDFTQGAAHEKLAWTLDADGVLVVGLGRPGVLQVAPEAVAIGYATVMVHSELRVGYAGVQAKAVCVA
jgi:hypothetical protein